MMVSIKLIDLISMQTRFLQNYGIDTTLDHSIDHDKIYSNYWSKKETKKLIINATQAI